MVLDGSIEDGGPKISTLIIVETIETLGRLSRSHCINSPSFRSIVARFSGVGVRDMTVESWVRNSSCW